MHVADREGSSAIASRSSRSVFANILPGVLPIAVFAAILLWFAEVDFYHRHFFDPGWRVAADNLARIAFVPVLAWLIYVPGHALAAAVIPAERRLALTGVERLVLGFCVGLGLWHVVLLSLGVAGLYYRSVMISLCGGILLASAKHFGEVSAHARLRLASFFAQRRPEEAVTCLGVALALALLLLTRGLYPGGSGDYYTHYFRYYLEVLRNHGLQPNDVWYHYYYSKGAGLFFLAMLLTDPEAPALVTFCCVAVAALAILALGRRVAPRSLWPACGAMIYLLYSLVGISWSRGGDFQKDHELVSAFFGLTVWALCMERITKERTVLLAAASCGVAAAIVTQPVGFLIGVFIALSVVWQILHKQWRRALEYTAVGAAIGVAIFAVYLLGYLQTGLASDQPLDLMLRFSDITRLDKWGVLPQLVVTAWIRNNYELVAPPGGWKSIFEVWHFSRLDLLWVYFAGFACAAAYQRLRKTRADSEASGPIRAVLGTAGPLVVLLMVISSVAGRSQNVSYGRFSTFFVPILMILGTALWGWLLTRFRGWSAVPRIVFPALLLGAVLVSWQITVGWAERTAKAAANGAEFLVGGYSLADAYARQDSGFSFGGINPRTLAAARQLPPGTPIWSADVDCYCMAPGCNVQSVVSFMMSPHLEEILDGPPERAKQRLQEAGINYFLFSSKSKLIDLLPYSPLFAPDTIDRYLGVKWTDGSTFLLTWKDADTAPLKPEFLDAYAAMRAAPESAWFNFSKLVPDIAADTAALRARAGFGQPADWPWRHVPEGNVDVVEATYGESCRAFEPKPPAVNLYRPGNVSDIVRKACEKTSRCDFHIDVDRLGDPAQGCGKDFWVRYRCGADRAVKTVSVPGEAHGKTAILDCSDRR